jgi:hypothetical protein
LLNVIRIVLGGSLWNQADEDNLQRVDMILKRLKADHQRMMEEADQKESKLADVQKELRLLESHVSLKTLFNSKPKVEKQTPHVLSCFSWQQRSEGSSNRELPKGSYNNNTHPFAGQLNSFTHLRAPLVLYDHGILYGICCFFVTKYVCDNKKSTYYVYLYDNT